MNSREEYYLISRIGISNIELDEMISKDDYNSYYYARDVLKGRFELGEEVISKDYYYSWSYAIDILKCRFRLGEEIIFKNTCPKDHTCDYFIKVMGYDHE